jgi:hypothetical protein
VRAQQRKLVFVTFTSTLAKWGEYAAFEVCGGSLNVVPIASGKVIDIDAFRDEVVRINSTTHVELRRVCVES